MALVQLIGNSLCSWIYGSQSREPDPISILAIVALTKYKEPETRIGISGHKVVTQQPSDYQLFINWQWLYRGIAGESHEDLKIIKTSLEKIARCYKPHQTNDHESKTINIFLMHVSEGLIKGLKQKTYLNKSSVTCDAIDGWNQLINEIRNGARTFESINPESESKLKRIWLTREISLLNGYLNELQKAEENKKNPDSTIKDYESLIQRKAEKLSEGIIQ